MTPKQAHATIKKLAAPGTRLVLLPMSRHGESHTTEDKNGHVIIAPADMSILAHEAAHTRQGNWRVAAEMVNKLGTAVGAGISSARLFSPKIATRVPRFLGTAITTASVFPKLAIESHANKAATAAGGDTHHSSRKYLTGAAIPIALTSLLDVISSRRKNYMKILTPIKYSNTVSTNTHTIGLGGNVNAWQSPIRAGVRANIATIPLGEFTSQNVAGTLENPKSLFNTVREIALSDSQKLLQHSNDVGRFKNWFRVAGDLPKKAAVAIGKGTISGGRSLGHGALRGAGIFGSMFVFKQLLDTLQHSPWSHHLPDVKTDVELIPTYAQKIQPLIYALGPDISKIVTQISIKMRGIKGLPTAALQSLRDTLVSLRASAVDKSVRGLISFWLGMVTAELLGRGLHGKNKPPMLNVQPSYPYLPPPPPPYTGYSINEYPELYFWPEVASMAGKVATAIPKWIGNQFVNVAKIPGSIKSGLSAGEGLASMSRRRVAHGISSAANLAMLGEGGLSISNQIKASRQMSDWDKQQKQSQSQLSQQTYGLTSLAGKTLSKVAPALDVAGAAISATAVPNHLRQRRRLNEWDSSSPPISAWEGYALDTPFVRKALDQEFLKRLRQQAVDLIPRHGQLHELPKKKLFLPGGDIGVRVRNSVGTGMSREPIVRVGSSRSRLPLTPIEIANVPRPIHSSPVTKKRKYTPPQMESGHESAPKFERVSGSVLRKRKQRSAPVGSFVESEMYQPNVKLNKQPVQAKSSSLKSLVAVSLGSGAIGMGAGIGVAKKKDYSLGKRLGRGPMAATTRRDIAKWLASTRQEGNRQLANKTISLHGRRRMFKNRMDMMAEVGRASGAHASRKLERRTMLKALADSEQRRVSAEGQLTALHGWSEPNPHLSSTIKTADVKSAVTEAMKPSKWSTTKKTLVTTAGLAAGGSSIEIGRRLGRHDERERIRRTVDLETI